MKVTKKEYFLTFLGAFAPLFITWIIDLVKSKPTFSTIKSIYFWVIDLINYKLPIWIFILILLVIFTILFIINNVKIERESFKKYKTDTIDGYKWSWGYRYDNSKGHYVIHHLKPMCNYCSTYLIIERDLDDNFKSIEVTFCPRCKQRRKFKTTSTTVEAIIIDNIQKNKYNK